MKNYKEMGREEFMQFFRDDEKLNELTADDRIEMFRTVLIGSSDFSIKLLEDVMSDYSVSGIRVIDVRSGEK